MNRIISLRQTESDDKVEPIVIEDFKPFAKQEWTSETAWGQAENDIDTSLLISARQVIESYIRQNITSKDIVCTVDLSEDFAVPNGEVIGSVIVTDLDGSVQTATFYGGANKVIYGLNGRFILTYKSGMQNVPELIKTAIKVQALFMYDNRLSGEISPQALTYLNGFVNYENY